MGLQEEITAGCFRSPLLVVPEIREESMNTLCQPSFEREEAENRRAVCLNGDRFPIRQESDPSHKPLMNETVSVPIVELLPNRMELRREIILHIVRDSDVLTVGGICKLRKRIEHRHHCDRNDVASPLKTFRVVRSNVATHILQLDQHPVLKQSLQGIDECEIWRHGHRRPC